MKLSEIITKHHSKAKTDKLGYSWHMTGPSGAKHTENNYALVIVISEDVLKSARYREGDGVDISFGVNQMTLLLSPSHPFRLNVRNKTSNELQLKVATKGIEKVRPMLPLVRNLTNLEVLGTEVGKIHVRLPIVQQLNLGQ